MILERDGKKHLGTEAEALVVVQDRGANSNQNLVTTQGQKLAIDANQYSNVWSARDRYPRLVPEIEKYNILSPPNLIVNKKGITVLIFDSVGMSI